MPNLITTLIYAGLALQAHGAAVSKRQTPEQASQLAAQVSQLSAMNAPALASDAAYQASAIALISSQAAAQTAYQNSVIAAHSVSDADWIAAQIATISAEAHAMGLDYSVPSGAAAPYVSDSPSVAPETTSAPAPTTLATQAVAAKFVQAAASQAPASTASVASTPSTASHASGDAVASSAGSANQPAGTWSADWTNSPVTGAAAPGTSRTGDLTWYDVGLGACGVTSASSDPIVAVSETLFDMYNNGNPNKNPLCGKWVSIIGKSGTYKAQIVDRCTGCSENDLDLSQTLFNEATNNGDGRVHNMQWSFI